MNNQARKRKKASAPSRCSCFASRRRRVIRQASAEGKIEAFLATNPADVSYLSGFTGDESYLLFSRNWAVLITDSRFTEQAQSECEDIEIHTRSGPMSKTFLPLLRGRGVRRIGIQAEHVTLGMQKNFTQSLGSRKIIPISGVTVKLRAVKDAEEIKIIRRAVRIAQDAFLELSRRGAAYMIGRTEGQIAAKLDYLIRLRGAEGAAFPTIVAAGANGSRPHHMPGRTKIKPDQPVLFDWGAKVAGYCSDLTRVVFTGKIPPKIREIYEVVRQAQQASIRSIKAGVRSSTPDKVARKIITQAGFGEQFTHGLGHGFGRDIHEAPALSKRHKTPLRAGMVVTVEPGIYLPGLGGVRIEDDILVKASGQQKLSTLSRSLNDMILK